MKPVSDDRGSRIDDRGRQIRSRSSILDPRTTTTRKGSPRMMAILKEVFVAVLRWLLKILTRLSPAGR
jgi:hypothetical protein